MLLINKDIERMADKLKRLHKSAYPVTVRGALNDAAFYTKKKTLPVEFDKQFLIRKKSFIKASSGVNKSANTFDVDKMVAEVGILKNKSAAARGLKVQETGGRMKKEAVPQTAVRISGNIGRLVRKKYYYNKYKNAPRGVISRTAKETIIKVESRVYAIYPGSVWKTLYVMPDFVNLKKRPFLKPAAERSFVMMPKFFEQRADKKMGIKKTFYELD